MEAHSAVEEGPFLYHAETAAVFLQPQSSPPSREANFSVVVSRRIRPAADSKKPDLLRLRRL